MGDLVDYEEVASVGRGAAYRDLGNQACYVLRLATGLGRESRNEG